MNIHKITRYLLMLCAFTSLTLTAGRQDEEPLRLAMAGIPHGHLWEVISHLDKGDSKIVGIAEKDDYLRGHSGLRDKLDPNLFYTDFGEMLDKTHPEAVIVYESIHDHLRVVEACAPGDIHVIVEKPLAVNSERATQMAPFACEENILLLASYETTWYNTNHEAFRPIDSDAIGKVDRINAYDGHQGPFEINCRKEFTNWLADSVLNSGGTVIDFGCYGANLTTRLMKDEKPLSVYAVLRRNKPNLYLKIDDDATIIVEYPPTTVRIMESWCWPMGRKDMHIYGDEGYIYQDTPKEMWIYTNEKERQGIAPSLNAPYNSSSHFLKAAVRKEIDVSPADLSSLENNLMVVRILDVAIQSAKSKAVIRFF